MSWATIVDNQLGSSNDANDSSSVAYGEGALHTIRTAYNEAILCSSSVVDCQDQRWFEAKERLEFVYNECNNYLRSQFGTSVRRQIQELCYVAKRNLINLLLKDAASSATCYSLILDTAQAMLELNKFDASLILLATRYAKQYNDWWTYKQLILLHQSNFPLMYRNLVLNEFNKNSKEMNTIESHNLHIGEFSTADSPLKLSGCSLNTKSAVPFVTFLAHKLLAASCDGAAFSGNNISSNFNMGWVCVELDSAHSPDDMQICQEPAAVTEQREEHGELTNTTTNILQQSQPKESTVVDVLGGEDLVQPLPEVEEEQNQSQAQVQVEATRVSGRVGRRTDRAAAAAADNTAGLPGKGLTRASSQSQLSSGDDSDEHANVQSIKVRTISARTPVSPSVTFAHYLFYFSCDRNC